MFLVLILLFISLSSSLFCHIFVQLFANTSFFRFQIKVGVWRVICVRFRQVNILFCPSRVNSFSVGNQPLQNNNVKFSVLIIQSERGMTPMNSLFACVVVIGISSWIGNSDTTCILNKVKSKIICLSAKVSYHHSLYRICPFLWNWIVVREIFMHIFQLPMIFEFFHGCSKDLSTSFYSC